MKRVLFLCSANSARSLMAETILREMAGTDFEVASAGTSPTTPHPLALETLEAFGLPTENLTSQSVKDVLDQPWDYVITLCDRASRECESLPSQAQHIAWDFPDPVESGRINQFRLVFREIRERIRLFVEVHTNPREAFEPPVSETFFKALGDSTRQEMMLLIYRTGELCVCELTEALGLSQPKISRHLAYLRERQLLVSERRNQWMYYRLHPAMPEWMHEVLATTANALPDRVNALQQKLTAKQEEVCL